MNLFIRLLIYLVFIRVFLFAIYTENTTYLTIYRKWYIKLLRKKDTYIFMHIPPEKYIKMMFAKRRTRLKEFVDSMTNMLNSLEKGKVYKIGTHSIILNRLLRTQVKNFIKINEIREVKYRGIGKLGIFLFDLLTRIMILNFSDLWDKQRKYYVITFTVL